MNEQTSGTSRGQELKAFLKTFRMQIAAGEGPGEALRFAVEEVAEETLRAGLESAIGLARGHGGRRGAPEHLDQVPGTLRLCLSVGYSARDVPRFLAVASRILQHNDVYYDNSQEDGLNSAFVSPERYEIAQRHEMRFFYSALYWLLDSGIDPINVLSTLKVDVVSQDLAYAIRALMEEGPGQARAWGGRFAPSFVDAMLALDKERNLEPLLDACHQLGDIPD